jgi:hypothetical protein
MGTTGNLSSEELNQLLYSFYTGLAWQIPPASIIARERLDQADGAKLEILDALRKKRDEAVLDWAQSLPIEMVKAVFGAEKLAESLLEDALKTLYEKARDSAKGKFKDWLKGRLEKGKLHITYDDRSLPGARILIVYEHETGLLTVIVSRIEPRTFTPVFRQTPYEKEITLRPYVATLTARLRRDELHKFSWPEGLEFRFAPALAPGPPKLEALPLTPEQELAALEREVREQSRSSDLATDLRPARERLKRAAERSVAWRPPRPREEPRLPREEAAQRRHCAALRQEAAQAQSDCRRKQAALAESAAISLGEGPVEGFFAERWKQDRERCIRQDEVLPRLEEEAKRLRAEYEQARAAYDALFWGTADRKEEGMRLAGMYRVREEKYRQARQKEHELEITSIRRMSVIRSRWSLENITEEAVRRVADERLRPLLDSRPWAATERHGIEFEAEELLAQCRRMRVLDAEARRACEAYRALRDETRQVCQAAEAAGRSRELRGIRQESERQLREVLAREVLPLSEMVRVTLTLDREVRRLWDAIHGEVALVRQGLSQRSLDYLESQRKAIILSVIEMGRVLDEVNYHENVRTGFDHPLDARLFLELDLGPEGIQRLRRDNERPPQSLQEAIGRTRRDLDLLLVAMRPISEAKRRLLQRHLEGMRRLDELLGMREALDAPIPEALKEQIEESLSSWEAVRRESPAQCWRGAPGATGAEVDRLVARIRERAGIGAPPLNVPQAPEPEPPAPPAEPELRREPLGIGDESQAGPEPSPPPAPAVEGVGPYPAPGAEPAGVYSSVGGRPPAGPRPARAAGSPEIGSIARRAAPRAPAAAGLQGLLSEKALVIAAGGAAAAVTGLTCLGALALVIFLVLRAREPVTTPEPSEAPELSVVAPLPVEIPEGLGTGDVQITLLWEGDADLDLHVTDPNGEEISYMSPTSSSGGRLDRDTIPCREEVPQPVENVFWPSGGAPRGRYVVSVHYYAACTTGAPMDFEIIIRLDEELFQHLTGTLADGERLEMARFDY